MLELLEPKTLDKVIGNKKTIDILSSCFPTEKKIIILVGSVGVGKTLIARLLMQKKNFVPHTIYSEEFASSETRSQVERLMTSRGFDYNALILEDIQNIDNLQFLYDLLLKTHKPVIMTCTNSYQVEQKKVKADSNNKYIALTELFTIIKLYMPGESEIKTLMPQLFEDAGLTPFYGKIVIGSDMRTTSLMNLYGSDMINDTIFWNQINRFFYKRDINDLPKDPWFWIYDTLSKIYQKYDLLEAFEILSLANHTNNLYILEDLKPIPNTKQFKITFPLYLKKLKEWNLKEKEKKKEKKHKDS